MKTDWSVACGADDPVVVIPWANKDRSLCYFDLRSEPNLIDAIPEAQQYDCIATALRRCNGPESPVFTAKCDVWAYPEKLFDAEDLEEFEFAQGSYIDLIPRDSNIFSIFTACETQLRSWSKMAASIELPQSRCEWTLRPAQVLRSLMAGLPGVRESGRDDVFLHGFATTFYVWGYGSSPKEAASAWSNSLLALAEPVSSGSGCALT